MEDRSQFRHSLLTGPYHKEIVCFPQSRHPALRRGEATALLLSSEKADNVMTTLQREKAGNVMTTLQRMNILFAHDFSKLRSLEAQESRSMRQRQYSLQRRTIGQHCYLAEEVLEPDELAQLKQAFQLNTFQWQAYKAKGIEGLTNMRE